MSNWWRIDKDVSIGLLVGILQPHYELISSKMIFKGFKYMNAFELLPFIVL